MSTVNIKINGVDAKVEAGTTILSAAKKAGFKIPTLCYHPDLPAWASCGICVVKIEGSPKMLRACAATVTEGMSVITQNPEIHEIRKTVIEMILSTHPNDCLQCLRNGQCELQTLAGDFGIRDVPFESRVQDIEPDESSCSIVFNPQKCIKCGRCVNVCQQLQDVWALEFIGRGDDTRMAGAGDVVLNETPCIKCGQCSAHCPVGAIYEVDETKKLLDAINEPDTHVAVQIAPAVRAAIGEAFGMAPGEITTGKIYAALRRLGVDAVFDTNFAADLTIMEEGTELISRLTKGTGPLPLITSCCPAWTDYMEKYFHDMIPHFSTAKSPMMMQGAITKTYYADKVKIDPAKICSVAIMPCTAKKYETRRSDNMQSSGFNDVDFVLTTRELARLIKAQGIEFTKLPDEKADSPIGMYSGAGTIFGNTGGVMEAAIRTVNYVLTGKNLDKVEVEAVRGMEGVRRGSVDIGGTEVRVAVAHGMANVRDLMKEVQEARDAGKEPPYHFIEVMACRGGCIAGGGQPYFTTDEIRQKRVAGIYKDDEASTVRCSHENPEITEIYKDFLGEPNSHKAHKYLHTVYVPRPLYRK